MTAWLSVRGRGAGADAADAYPPGWRVTPGLRGTTTAAGPAFADTGTPQTPCLPAFSHALLPEVQHASLVCCSPMHGWNLASMQMFKYKPARLTAPHCAVGPVGIGKAAAAAAAGGTGGQAAAAAPGAAGKPPREDAGAAAPDPASTAAVDNWDASTAGGPARELLRRYVPLGASDCPLFGRKFAAPDNGVDLARAAHFMARDGAGAGLGPAHRRVLWFD